MRLSTALLGVLALSGLLACAAPPDREAQRARPAHPAARSEPEPPDAPPVVRQDDPSSEEALRAAQMALRAAAELDDREKQRQTVKDERSLGVAIFSWLDDQLKEGGDAGQPTVRKATVDAQDYPPITQEELERLLVPKYIYRLPVADGWGHPYEVRLKRQTLAAERIFMIRSPGRDGVFSTDSYTPGAFDAKDLDEDIVFADNFLVRWPD